MGMGDFDIRRRVFGIQRDRLLKQNGRVTDRSLVASFDDVARTQEQQIGVLVRVGDPIAVIVSAACDFSIGVTAVTIDVAIWFCT